MFFCFREISRTSELVRYSDAADSHSAAHIRAAGGDAKHPESIGRVRAWLNLRPTSTCRSHSRTPSTAPRSSTCSVSSRTARSRRSNGSRRTPSWRRPWRTRSRSRPWRAPSSAGSSHCGEGSPSSAATRSRRWRRSVVAIDQFHLHTAPSDWLEGLVKAYVGDGLANDFYREIAAFLDPDTRDLVVSSVEDEGHAAFVVERVRADHRRRPVHRRPARPVGAPADGGGAHPGATGRRASATPSPPCWPEAWTAPASTWPPSAGCSPG